MAKSQNSSLTEIEENALNEEMKTTKWRCRAYVIVQVVNAFFFLYFPILFGSLEPHYPVTYPGLEDKTMYHSFVIYQILGPLFVCVNMTAGISFGIAVIALVGHAGSHATAIAAEIVSLEEAVYNRPAEVSERVTYVLKRHLHLKAYIKKVNDLFSIVIGFDYPMYAITTAVSFQRPSSETVTVTIYAIVSFLTFCYFGQYLINTGENIAVAIYASGWEFMKNEDAKKLLMMLRNAQEPMTLTPFKIIRLTHPTFMTFMRLLYSAGACAFGTS